MKTIQQRIRDTAKRKAPQVVISGKVRSRSGFTLVRPDGTTLHSKSKRVVLSNLLAELRCSQTQVWRVIAGHKHQTH